MWANLDRTRRLNGYWLRIIPHLVNSPVKNFHCYMPISFLIKVSHVNVDVEGC